MTNQTLTPEFQAWLAAEQNLVDQENAKQQADRQKEIDKDRAEREEKAKVFLPSVPEALRPYCEVNYAEEGRDREMYNAALKLCIPGHTTLYVVYDYRYNLTADRVRVNMGGHYDQDVDLLWGIKEAAKEWKIAQAQKDEEAKREAEWFAYNEDAQRPQALETGADPIEDPVVPETPMQKLLSAIQAQDDHGNEHEALRTWAMVVQALAQQSISESLVKIAESQEIIAGNV